MSKVIRRFGPYDLHERVASGGMAEVYRARLHNSPGHFVALKLILPHLNLESEFVKMMEREARIMSRLAHPNIARLLDFGQVEGRRYLAMEFIEGHTLKEVMAVCRERGSWFPINHMLYILSCVLSGLHQAHIMVDERGRPAQIIHRDVSPGNILISRNGEVKVIDFGIAKGRFSPRLTRVGRIKGKVRYMSPEQTLGKSLGPASDIFSAGSVLFEALTLESPFNAGSDTETMVAIRRKRVVPPSHLNPLIPFELDRMVLRALHKDPDGRYPSAMEFSRVLSSYLNSYWGSYQPSQLAGYLDDLLDRELADLGEDTIVTMMADEAATEQFDLTTRIEIPGAFTRFWRSLKAKLGR